MSWRHLKTCCHRFLKSRLFPGPKKMVGPIVFMTGRQPKSEIITRYVILLHLRANISIRLFSDFRLNWQVETNATISVMYYAAICVRYRKFMI